MTKKPASPDQDSYCNAHQEITRKLEKMLMILYILLGLVLGIGGKQVSELVQVAAPVMASPTATESSPQ